MSRFRGWKLADLRGLNVVGEQNHSGNRERESGTVIRRKNKVNRDYTKEISAALTRLGVNHVREYKFLHDRRFRFDIAIPEKKIAVEFEGGIWGGGRHTRGKGYASDVKKYNLAVRHGWRLLRYTTEDAKKDNWAFAIALGIKEFTETNEAEK